ncbi:MAG: hypothetical protein HQL20_10615 [Candidatus Omnitrophica bacterium]|nr:hypothetical protein [Candidatus Omnitrophota bacterium]
MIKEISRRAVTFVVLGAFLFTGGIGPIPFAQGQELFGSGLSGQAAGGAGLVAGLPQPGARIGLSAAFVPALLKGVKVYPNDPLRLDFILDKGEAGNGVVMDRAHSESTSGASADDLKNESKRLIKYFLASLTVPEKDLWVTH